MSRSNWKGSYFSKNLYNKIFLEQNFKFWNKKVWDRNSVIPNFLCDKNIYIHNGKVFKRILITREKVGFKFGDFSYTRNYVFKKILKKVKKN
jgi:small subunit ribosomal protein S19